MKNVDVDCAYRLAEAGARVVLLDRARFPRDKPCGGGLTGRALRELPIDVEDVVEDRVNEFEFRLAGDARDLSHYAMKLDLRLGRISSASWAAKRVFDRFPRTAFALTRPRFVWPIVEQLIQGDLDHPGASRRGPGRAALKALKTVARASGGARGVSST